MGKFLNCAKTIQLVCCQGLTHKYLEMSDSNKNF